MKTNKGLREAIAAAGGVRALARKIGVTHPAILGWNLVPVDRMLAIEKVTGVPRERLRPDLYNHHHKGRR